MDANVSGSAIENPYQFAANEDCVQEVTAENPYDHVQACGRTELSANEDRVQEVTTENSYDEVQACGIIKFPESASKEKPKSQAVVKVAILSTILVLLFGLALCGILLVSKEKARLDQTEKQNNEIRTDMQREQQEANATWMEKIIALELRVKNLQRDQRKVNETWVKKLSDMQGDQRKINATWMKKILAMESQVKNMLRVQTERNATWIAEISAMKQQMRETSNILQRKLRDQALQNNLTNQKLKAELNYLLTEAGWHKASNGLYYKIFNEKQNYTNARLQCQLIVSRLASTGLRDLAVREELVNLIKAEGKNVWIGANDMKTEGTFVWEDSVTSNESDIDWINDQPDNKGKNEDCAQYVKWGDWKVNDNNCASRLVYMCEKEENL